MLSQRLKTLVAQKQVWTAEDAVPYLKTCVVGGEAGDPEGLRAWQVALFKKHAKAVHAMKRDGKGREVFVTNYVALPH